MIRVSPLKITRLVYNSFVSWAKARDILFCGDRGTEGLTFSGKGVYCNMKMYSMRLSKRELQVILACIVTSSVIDKDHLPPGISPAQAYDICDMVIEKIMHRLSPTMPEP